MLNSTYSKMKIESTEDGKYSLTGMDEDDLMFLASMIRGASLCERRQFHHVLLEIKTLKKTNNNDERV